MAALTAIEKAKFRATQNAWHIETNNGTNLTATNTKTGEVFSGTTAAFNALFAAATPVNPDTLFPAVTVATLPSFLVPYQRLFVTDALTPTFNAAVVGGGAVKVPVFSDGAGWKVG